MALLKKKRKKKLSCKTLARNELRGMVFEDTYKRRLVWAKGAESYHGQICALEGCKIM